MENNVELEKFSIGIGDRFGKECLAQLEAVNQAKRSGVNLGTSME